ncbi:MAG: phosphatase PAP2 family protein [Odoribacter sp.]
MRSLLLPLFVVVLLLNSSAQSKKNIETSTDLLMFVNPVAGFVGSLVIGDYQGTKQIVLSGATSLALTYALKYSIKKERPDHSDHHSFPSAHTSIAFQGASFIQRRYGWKWGTPAYLLSAYVAWGRTYADKHDWWDVLGGAAIGTVGSYLFTRPFARKHELTFSPTLINARHPGFYASISW